MLVKVAVLKPVPWAVRVLRLTLIAVLPASMKSTTSSPPVALHTGVPKRPLLQPPEPL